MQLFGRELDRTSVGIALTVLSVLVFGFQDVAAKILVQTWSPFQVTMMRYWAFGLFSLLMVMRQAPLRQAFRSKMPGWQIARGILLVVDIWLFAFAVRTVPLGELQSIILLYPLLVTLLAVPVLGEKVGPWRIGAVVAGFLGALVILRPGGLPVTIDVLFGLGAATAYSSYIVLTRKVAQADSVWTSMVYVGVVGMVLTSAVGVWFFAPMGMDGILLIGVMIVTTIVGHGLMMLALEMAPASTVQPFNYLMLPWAAILSLIFFSHFIDTISLIGATIIVGSGLLVWARERHKRIKVTRAEAIPPGKE